LPGESLGFTDTATGEIWIDRDAAGYGWFVDRTPKRNNEFVTKLNNSATLALDGLAAGHFDLLTVVTHEFGHLLGLLIIRTPLQPGSIRISWTTLCHPQLGGSLPDRMSR